MTDNELRAQSLFGIKARINFELVNRAKIRGISCNSMSIMNSVLDNAEFTNVDFGSSDVFGTKIIDSRFEATTFENADINSIWASQCTFIGVHFDGSTFTDSMLIKCEFIDCTFSHVALTNNQFTNCKFVGFHLNASTTTLNSFVSCVFSHAEFKSSFYYQIFENCKFTETEFDPILLGYNYGFTTQQIEKLFGIHNANDINHYFTQNQLLLNAAILRINLYSDLLDTAMVACTAVIVKMLTQDFLIKADELLYIIKLFTHFIRHKLIAPLCLVRCWEEIKHLQLHANSNAATDKARESLQSLINLLYLSYKDYLFELQQKLVSVSSPEVAIEIVAHYDKKPELPLTTILHAIMQQHSLHMAEPIILRTEVGSFIEYITTFAPVVPYLAVLVSLLGITLQHTREMRKEQRIKKEALLQKANNNGNVFDLTRKELVFSSNIVSAETEHMAASMLKITIELKIAGSNDYKGYNSSNVKSIQILYV
jgi:uncharacterized protein YjbI with pentapeptide repeats